MVSHSLSNAPLIARSLFRLSPERFLAVFAVASLVAVATGCLVVAVDDASAGAWPLDLAAWGAGAVVALAVSRFASPAFARVVTLAAPIGLLASLAYPGQ